MKNLLALGFILLSGYTLAQKKLPADPFQRKNSLISFHAGITNYEAFYSPKDKSADFQKTGKKSFGVGVGWWKTVRQRIDFHARYTGTFSSYPKEFISKDSIGIASFSSEMDGSLVYRFFDERTLVNPFISAGLGTGFYNPGAGVYAPFGAGVQVHTANGFYGFLQAQLKMRLVGEPSSNYLHFSIGIAQGISSYKPPKILIPSLAIPIILDSDDDGIADEKDGCPDEKGLAAANGCPDGDGDSVPDKLDKCPDVPGLVKYGGCGIPDSDKDGISDEEDNCPNEAGVVRYHGCKVPDSDNDGINDEEDKCPELYGESALQGCPEVKIEIQQKANLAARSVQFESSSDILLASAKTALDEVAVIMRDEPLLHLDIEGHTDNTGHNNYVLSVKRAGAVRKYLMNKNIASDRLSSAGFGDKNPIADNNSIEGRAQNRRVEMKFRY